MSKRIKLKVASPCQADWESMSGDEAKRFCGACNQNVYQLSNMSTDEVETLLKERKGLRTCGRFFQRADGTVMTSDCKVGVSQKRKRRVLKVVGAAAFSMSAVGVGYALAPDAKNSSEAEIIPADQTYQTMGAIAPDEIPIVQEPQALPEPKTEPEMILGEIAPEPDPKPEPVYIETLGDIDPESVEMMGDVFEE